MHTPRPKALDASDIVIETPGVTADEIAAISAVIVSAAAAQRPSGRHGAERTGWEYSRLSPRILPQPGPGQWVRSYLPG